jgi:poly(3-hydroxybutyrate) depolymerase
MCEVFTDLQAHELNLDTGGQPRKALVVEPSNIRDGAAVVLAFHGSNQTAAGFHKAIGGSLDGLVAGGDAVVIYLDGYGGTGTMPAATPIFQRGGMALTTSHFPAPSSTNLSDRARSTAIE